MTVSTKFTAGPTGRRRLITTDSGFAARALDAGAVVAHGFGNFYAITTRADEAMVRRVNLMKGRPPNQIGSITAPPSAIRDLWDFGELPPGLTRRRVLQLVDALFQRWADQIEAVLWEARPRLNDDADTARLSQFVVATLEGAWFMSRVKGGKAGADGIATELKRSVRSYARERAPAAAEVEVGAIQ